MRWCECDWKKSRKVDRTCSLGAVLTTLTLLMFFGNYEILAGSSRFRVWVGSEAAGFEQGSGDVMGRVAGAVGGAA